MADKRSYQTTDSSNKGPNIVYKGTNHKLRKNGTKMINPPSTDKTAFKAHSHGHPRNG